MSRGLIENAPREGALELARSLAATNDRPRRIVYVSCNPATLARDCAVLVHEGAWTVRAAGVINMFPHTSHVESIALIERDGRMMAVAWALGLVEIVVVAMFSGQIAGWIAQLLS